MVLINEASITNSEKLSLVKLTFNMSGIQGLTFHINICHGKPILYSKLNNDILRKLKKKPSNRKKRFYNPNKYLEVIEKIKNVLIFPHSL